MKKVLVIGFMLVMSSLAFSQYPNECIRLANNQMMDFGTGRPVSFDANGKTVISNPDKITKMVTKDGVQTITYKVKQLKFGSMSEYETVEQTVVITRNAQGQLINISKEFDVDSQVKRNCPSCQWNLPILKSVDNNFIYDHGKCSVNQQVGLEMKDEKSKAEKKVYFDKKFCDQLAPVIKQMGSKNTGQCVGLFNQAEFAFNHRNKELAKEGKSFKDFSYRGTKLSKNNTASGAFNLGVAIEACSLPNFGMGNGSGMGGIGGGMMGIDSDTAPASENVKSAK